MEVALLYDPIHTNMINYETLEYPKNKKYVTFQHSTRPQGHQTQQDHKTHKTHQTH